MASSQTQSVMSAHIKTVKAEENVPEQIGDGAVIQKAPEGFQTAVSVSEKESEYDSVNKEQRKEKQFDADAIKKAVEDLNRKMQNTEAQYSVHEGTKRIMIKILDKDSQKVIKEITPEKMLDVIQNIWETAGLLVDEKR